jgi:OOP family OmpA-OmpF porin
MKRSLCIATAILSMTVAWQVVTPSMAGAAWQPPSFELGGYGGWVYYDTDRGLEGYHGGGRLAYFPSSTLGLEGAFTFSPANAPNVGVDQDFMWQQADLIFQVPMGHFIPFGKLGVGNTSVTRDGDDERLNKFTWDVGTGAKLWFNDRIALRTDVNWYFVDNNGWVPRGDDRLTDYMLQIGLQIGFGAGETDEDGDGVTDDIDVCPATPVGVRVDARGCPLDSDGDGVPDHQDACGNTPRGAQIDARGCPIDSDGDGVFDGLDRCASTPAGANVDASGCPMDADNDGVFDGIDQCPETPADVQVDIKGCPLVKEIEEKLVLHSITFKSASAEILPSSYEALDEVAASLKAYPDVRIEIRGYADSSGPEEFNLKLTQERAHSVAEYLIKTGIDPSRLVARGYGEADPIASNDTQEGRAMNRRVELHRLP